jgi:flagellar hook-associated protein 1 FlgK
MSLGSVLSIARGALSAHQTVIQTAGHNIANVETPGFTRQRVELSANFPQRLPFGSVGTGLKIDDVVRVRDQLLDVTYRQESAGAADAGFRRDLLASLEGILGEPSETGLSASMDAMWSAWSDFATQPTSQAARAVVLQRAQTVATTLNGFDSRIGDLRGQTTLRLSSTLTSLNALADSIAKLNGQIVSAEVGGNQAPDLRDQRDRALDALSKLGEVRVMEGPSGAQQVLLGNNLVVDGIHAKQFQIAVDTGTTTAIAMVGDPARPLKSFGGSVAGMVDFLNGGLRETQDRLDALANGLARAVNEVHAVGKAPGDPTRAVFVDRTDNSFVAAGDPFRRPSVSPGTVTARTIGVNARLLDDASRLAASSDATGRPADNDVALAMAALRTASTVRVANGGAPVTVTVAHRLPGQATPDVTTSLGEHYRAAASSIGTQAKDARGSAEVREALAAQAEQRRQSYGGVNLDEELTQLMRAQQAYAAAAKVISAADEMMQTLVQMI